MSNLLNDINEANDIKNIPQSQYKALAKEIRKFLVNNISNTGGHLASNLGAVELTIALHAVLDFPNDKIIWDVGHQSYTHKILTGRKDMFDRLRKYNGLSGFPKRKESPCDVFDTGHSSTSISVALGMAEADRLDNKDSTIVAFIGDGALTGGMAYEALNNLSRLDRNLIIVLNDNNMSISENVGGMSEYLNRIRVGKKYNDLKEDIEKSLGSIPRIGGRLVKSVKRTKNSIKQLFVAGGIFDDLGITYIGPVDGHDIDSLIRIFNDAKQLDHPVLIHASTKKGYGYRHAMKNPSKFHGVDPFDKYTGEIKKSKAADTYTDIFAGKLVEMAADDENIVAITAAMPDGTGLAAFKEKYPERFFDVGIAEEHAVTFAAGLAASGKKPYVAIYSSFFQRAYDQIIHDVCMQNMPVRLIVDRAGLVGRDGETHQGIFDIAYLSSIPNLVVLSPMNRMELESALEFSKNYDGPIAIRYSRGEAFDVEYNDNHDFLGLNSRILIEGKTNAESSNAHNGKSVAIIAVGNIMEEAVRAVNILNEKNIYPTLVDARIIKPLDKAMIDDICTRHDSVVIVEEGIKRAGYGQAVESYICEKGYRCRVLGVAIDDMFVSQGSVSHLRKKLGLDAESIAEKIIREA